MQMRLKKNWGWMPIENKVFTGSKRFSCILSILIFFTGLKITQFILQLCTVNVKISYKNVRDFTSHI